MKRLSFSSERRIVFTYFIENFNLLLFALDIYCIGKFFQLNYNTLSPDDKI